MTAKTALKFYALLTPFGLQEVCEPCLTIVRGIIAPPVEIDPATDRTCDDCGAYRLGSVTAFERSFA